MPFTIIIAISLPGLSGTLWLKNNKFRLESEAREVYDLIKIGGIVQVKRLMNGPTIIVEETIRP